jgi:hypothetical protein
VKTEEQITADFYVLANDVQRMRYCTKAPIWFGMAVLEISGRSRPMLEYPEDAYGKILRHMMKSEEQDRAQRSIDGFVKIPKTADEAAAMLRVSALWLHEKAPEVLRGTMRGTAAGKDAERYRWWIERYANVVLKYCPAQQPYEDAKKVASEAIDAAMLACDESEGVQEPSQNPRTY